MTTSEYRIQCRIDSCEIDGSLIFTGSWQNYTKIYKSLPALLDAWNYWRKRNWVGTCTTGDGYKYKHVWHWRPVHFYRDAVL